MSRTALYSDSWHRVSSLRPRLRSHLRMHRHVYRDEIWYVIQNQGSGQFHRFTPEANLIISLMDGQRTVQQIWDIACQQLDDDAMPQDEVIRLMAELHRADVLQTDRVPDSRDLIERRRRQTMQQLKQYVGNPSALKLPLVDPDRWLERTMPWVGWLFSWVGAVLWLGVMAWGVVLGAMHWSELTSNSWDQVFAFGNVVLMALIYPLVKALHELGHAFVIKRRGGEVHEIGLMFLLMMPIPYVDGSAASAFPEKRWRMFVGAAGILVELFLAALAMIVWTHLEPGLARSVAYNVILICGVSTLLMNGNPLLRYDGYYVLSDAIEIPNLGQRANSYIGYLVKRYVFRLKAAEPQKSTPGERVWFVFYAVLSFVYRMAIMALAIFVVASRFFFVGVVLALWAVFSIFVLPLWRVGRNLFTDPQIQARRGRCYAMTASLLAAFVVLIAYVPVPSSTHTEGVIWLPPSSQVRASVSGFVHQVYVSDDTHVAADQPLLELENSELVRRQAVLTAQLGEYQARYHQAYAEDQVQAQIFRHQWGNLQKEHQVVQAQSESLRVLSPRGGRFVSAHPNNMQGRYVERGELLGYVLDTAEYIRIVVPQSGLNKIHRSTTGIGARLVQDSAHEYPVKIVREVPAATDQLPSMALSLQGGGSIGVRQESSQDGGARSSENLFVMDLSLPSDAPRLFLGSRVYVKFRHESEPLLGQVYDTVRRMVLRQLHV